MIFCVRIEVKSAMLEYLSELFLSLFPSLIKRIFRKKSHSETRKEYESLRREIATALVNYSRYYYNPILLSQSKKIVVPDDFSNASNDLRTLGAKLRAFSQTMPLNVKDMPVTKKDINEVSHCLIGLSNSFTTWPESANHYRDIEKWEKKIRDILSLSD